jgi:hypothetical protein
MLKSESGQGMVEYVLMIAFVVLGFYFGVSFFTLPSIEVEVSQHASVDYSDPVSVIEVLINLPDNPKATSPRHNDLLKQRAAIDIIFAFSDEDRDGTVDVCEFFVGVHKLIIELGQIKSGDIRPLSVGVEYLLAIKPAGPKPIECKTF